MFKGCRKKKTGVFCLMAFVIGLFLSFMLKPFLIIVVEGILILALCCAFFFGN